MSGVERESKSFECPICGRRGEIVIEHGDHARNGRDRRVYSVSKGFWHAPKHNRGRRFCVMCKRCKFGTWY